METIKILTPRRNLITREIIKISSLPIMTREDGCFSDLLNTNELEKIFSRELRISDTTAEDIDTISINEDLLFEIIGSLKDDIAGESCKDKVLRVFEEKSNDQDLQDRIGYTYPFLCKAEKNISSCNEVVALEYVIALNKNYISRQIRNLKEMINTLYKEDKIETAALMLSQVQTKEDLKSILAYVGYVDKNQKRKEKNNHFYEYNEDLVLSVMSKGIINSYVKYQMSKIDMYGKEKIEDDIFNGKNPYEILIQLDENSGMYSNTNGISERILKYFTNELYRNTQYRGPSLCFDCHNGYTSKCEKIRDIEKKSIEEYPFIISGFQVLKNDQLDRFIITKCRNFGRVYEPKIKVMHK